MDKLDIAIKNVKQSFLAMRRALIYYDKVNQERKKHLRSMIKTDEWPDVKSKMKDWLDITQELIDQEILYTGFDEDCVFGQKFIGKKLPKLRLVGSNEPPKWERLAKEWEDLTQYLLSKGYLDKIPDNPAFELRDYILGVQELVEIVEAE
jgi:hypothetical protein